MSEQATWHDEVFFGIHYDLHAGQNDTELGAEVTAENLREVLGRVRPDWIQCDCKGHPGWTSWPTETGSTSPGVVADGLRVHRDVCREMGIPLGMHYSGVMDRRAIELHPEWARVGADGQASETSTCLLSGYRDELMIPQMIELIDKYDVDGFWVDGENWAVQPCWCDRCREEFARRTGIEQAPAAAGEPHWQQWLAFHRELFILHVTRYAEAVHHRKPGCAVCSNWMYTVRQPEAIRAPVDYLSGDYTPNFGAYRAALEARFLDARQVSWDLMCWGFIRDYATSRSVYKTTLHLCQEVAEVLALGGAVMVYDKPQRTGHLVGWHHEVLAEVAEFCRLRRPVCFRTTTASDAAVLHLADHYYAANAPSFNYGQAVEPVEGALHALLETHHSTDVVNEEMLLERIEDYSLVVVPEQAHLGEGLTAALAQYAHAGGRVILSGAHLAREAPELIGAVADGEPYDGSESARTWGAIFLEVDGEATGVAGPWQRVRCTKAQPHALALLRDEPGKDASEMPAVTLRKVGRGRVLAVHGPVFREYYAAHCPRLRRLLGGLFDGLGIRWRVELDAPARMEVVTRRKDGRLLVNLINRGAGETTYPQRMIIDELPPVENVVLRVRSEGRPAAVTLQPGDTPLTWRYNQRRDVATVRVPRVDIHRVVAIDVDR